MKILCHKLPTFNLELNCRLIFITCRRVLTEYFYCVLPKYLPNCEQQMFIVAVAGSIFPVKWVTITLDIQKWRNEAVRLVATLGVPPAKSMCRGGTVHLTVSHSIGYEVGSWESTVRKFTDRTSWKHRQFLQHQNRNISKTHLPFR